MSIEQKELSREVVRRADLERSLEASSDPSVLARRLIERERRIENDSVTPRQRIDHPREILEHTALAFALR